MSPEAVSWPNKMSKNSEIALCVLEEKKRKRKGNELLDNYLLHWGGGVKSHIHSWDVEKKDTRKGCYKPMWIAICGIKRLFYPFYRAVGQMKCNDAEKEKKWKEKVGQFNSQFLFINEKKKYKIDTISSINSLFLIWLFIII